MNKYHPLAWRPPQDFASTHCVNCKAGWTRTAESGGALTVCLLDRAPVLSGMKDCDRYEPKSKEAPEARRSLGAETMVTGRNSEPNSTQSTTTMKPGSRQPDKVVRQPQ
jgi:hypothetical protein